MADESKPDWQVAIDLITRRLISEYPHHIFKIDHADLSGSCHIRVWKLVGEPIDYDEIQNKVIAPSCLEACQINGVYKSLVMGHYMGHLAEPIHA